MRLAFWPAVALILLPSAGLAGPSSEVTLVAVGDVMLARGVARKVARHDWRYPFAKVAKLLRGDIVFGNLECSLGETGRLLPKRASLAAPEEAAGALARAGFTVVSVANNHTFDRGRLGLANTLRILDARGLRYAGAGDTIAAAHRAAVTTVRGLRVAFLAYTDWPPEGYLSLADQPSLALADPQSVVADVRAARAQADVVVVSFHWGTELRRMPSTRQRGLARTAIDAGADLILGHHPHVRQPVQWYRGRPIFFSLGNFVFDQPGTDASCGWLAVLRLRKGEVTIARLGQVEIEACQPRLTAWQQTLPRP